MNSSMSSFLDFNRNLIKDLRAYGGKATDGPFQGRDVLILTTKGARSGEDRENPLVYTRDNEHHVIVASKGGGPTNPSWYHNLKTHPIVTVEARGEKFNTRAKVIVGWSVFHLHGVPLWTVALIPLAVVLVAGTAYHWLNSLHHFSEHMRHRHRVRELEAEVVSLKAHRDELLGMPDHSTANVVRDATEIEPEPPVATNAEPASSNGDLSSAKEPETAVVVTNGASEVRTPKPKTTRA